MHDYMSRMFVNPKVLGLLPCHCGYPGPCTDALICRIAKLQVSIRLVCLLTGMHVLNVATKDDFEVIQLSTARPFRPILKQSKTDIQEARKLLVFCEVSPRWQ